MSHIVGSRNKSIFLTSFFSSSGVHVSSDVTSTCFVVSISLTSETLTDCDADIILSQWQGSEREAGLLNDRTSVAAGFEDFSIRKLDKLLRYDPR
jgi:hypothetical protein